MSNADDAKQTRLPDEAEGDWEFSEADFLIEESEHEEQPIAQRRWVRQLVVALIATALVVNLFAVIPLIYNWNVMEFLKVTRELAKDERVQAYEQAIVVVSTSSGKGTGFNITEQGMIITNHHVVDDVDSAVIHFPDKTTLHADVVLRDPDMDLAVLKPQVPAGEDLPVLKVDSTASWREGMPVYYIGNPLFFNHIAGRGHVLGMMAIGDKPKPVMLIDAPIYNGNSGSPVIGEDGKVIAVIYATAEITLDGQQKKVGLAIPTNHPFFTDAKSKFAKDAADDNLNDTLQDAGDQPSNDQKYNVASERKESDEPVAHLLAFEEALGGLSFDTPVAIRHAADGSGRLFVVEQPGRIMVVTEHSGHYEKSVYLDLTNLVYDRGWEQGLLGLAFHPNFADNGKFYVNYTTKSTTVIAEYQQNETNPYQADPSSSRPLIEFEQPYSNHNGGELAFGPDGYLYIGTGDGGSSGDPQGNGQNLQSWLGKILRIDVDRTQGSLSYGIPEDNPFFGNQDGYREEIYAYGLRNPWRFSFDRMTGVLWAADVGQNNKEEINLIVSGGNYGWSIMEGSSCYRPKSGCKTADLLLPIYEYEPQSGGASITGGYVYRGEQIPELFGRYVFADFMDGRVWTLRYQEDEPIVAPEQAMLMQVGITSFGEDEAGEIYGCLYDGRIVRLSKI